MVFFCGQILNDIPRAQIRFKEVLKQIYMLGTKSLLIILCSAVFIGMVVAVQGFDTLEKFGAQAQLSQLLALSVFRELAPVITALLYAGRAGSSVAAEVGLMQVTEQIPAMEVMAISPFNRIILPRWIAGVVVVPLLTIIFSAVAIIGGYLIAVTWLNIDGYVFWSNMQSAVLFNVDVINGLYKSFIFGVVANLLALYYGYTAIPNASGVAAATTATVVFSSLMVLLLDFLLTSWMFGG